MTSGSLGMMRVSSCRRSGAWLLMRMATKAMTLRLSWERSRIATRVLMMLLSSIFWMRFQQEVFESDTRRAIWAMERLSRD